MKTKHILIFLSCFFCLFSKAQTPKDSLLTLLKNHPQKDIERCYILRELRKDEIRNFKLGDTYDQEAYAIAIKKIPTVKNNPKLLKEYKSFLSDYFFSQGVNYSEKYDLKNAEKYFSKALEIDLEIKQFDNIGSDYKELGKVYQEKGDINRAIDYYLKSIAVLKKRKGIEEEENNYMIDDYNCLSFIYYNKGDYSKAIQYQFEKLKVTRHKKSNQYFNKKLNISNIGESYNNIGFFYAKENETAKAFYYYNKAYKLQKSIQNNHRISLIYRNIGITFLDKKQYNKALTYFNLSTQLSEDKSIDINNTLAKGIIYLNTNAIDSAYANFSNALEIAKKNNISKLDADIYYNLSQVYFQKKNWNLAEEYAQKSIAISQKRLNILETKKCAELLYQIYKQTNNTAKALQILELSTKLNDSINRKENQNAMLKAEFKLENQNKIAQIKTLSKDKKIATLESERQKTIVLTLGILIISLVLISYFLFNKYKIKKQNELLKSQLDEAQKTIEAEKKATESELKALKSQMNPHFIFNALSGIQDQFMYGDKAIANEQMGNFTYLTRQILNVSGKKQILIATEIEILSKYLELEKMRFKTDFEYQINLSETIDEDYHEIPPMLIQPFVENSIKHGLLHKNGLKKVSIHFELDPNEEYIICTIEDNGIGRTKSAEIKANSQIKHEAFSTQSIEDRLLLLNENLHLQNLITYEDILENNLVMGTKVTINIPLI